MIVHAVQHTVSRPVRLPSWPDADHRTRLVFITNGIDPGPVRELFNAVVHATPWTPAKLIRKAGDVLIVPTSGTGSGDGVKAVALSPDETELWLCMGTRPTFPLEGELIAIDLAVAGLPFQSIPIHASGTALNFSTHESVVCSPDGRWVFAVEYGFQPGTPLTSGFGQGGAIVVVDRQTRAQVAVIPTLGMSQLDVEVGRLSRFLYVAQLDLTGRGEVLKVDIDPASPTLFGLAARLSTGPEVYTSTAGPVSLGVSPDGTTIAVGISTDNNNPVPVVRRINGSTGAQIGSDTTVGDRPAALEIQRYRY